MRGALAPRPVIGVAPVVVAGGVAFVGVGLAMLVGRLQEKKRREQWQVGIGDGSRAAVYRRPPYEAMRGEDLNRLMSLLDWQGRDTYILPLTGVTIERQAIERERMRRAGSGFLFIAPAANAVLLAERLGRIATTLWAFWAASRAWQRLQWGSINGPQFGPADPGIPEWWPTGSYSPSGNNVIGWSWNRTYVSNTLSCERRTEFHTIPGWEHVGGLKQINVRGGDAPLQGSGCGVVPCREQFIEFINAKGETVEIGHIWTDGWVDEIHITDVTVRPAVPAEGRPYPAAPVPLPVRPRVVPQPMPEVLPEVLPLPQREPDPVVVPGTVPLAPPANPNPARRPASPPAVAPGSRPQLPPGEVGQSVGTDGKVQAPKPLPLPVTPPTTEIPWPGAPPIGQPGQQPRPDLVGIAKELGKIEKKLAIMNTPTRPLPPGTENLSSIDWKRLLWDLLQGMFDAGEYRVWSPCLPQGEPGSATDPLVTSWGASLTPIGGLENRLNALAQLIQDAKVLPQPTCRKPAIGGEWVTVQFESDEPSPDSWSRLKKVFRYLDQNFSPLAEHVSHWQGFTWQAGPWIVSHNGGIWGNPQVWADSPDEGKRVIRHAAAIAGVDVDATGSTWQVSRSTSSRTGKPGLMRVRIGRKGNPMVSKREGSSGGAEYLLPAGSNDGGTNG
jgi:hypothetical protein